VGDRELSGRAAREWVLLGRGHHIFYVAQPERKTKMTLSYNIPTQTVALDMSVAEVEQLTADGIANIARTIVALVNQLKAQTAAGEKT
jgi:hypothetical protein